MNTLITRKVRYLLTCDLARYVQVDFSKPRSLETGAHPIRLIGERFHDLPLLSLSVAWLTWEAP
jgi:hypothetical protein